MNSNKLKVRKKQLKPNSDIIIDNFYFYRSKWLRLILNIVSEFNEISKCVLIGDKWKQSIGMDVPVSVTRLTDKQKYDNERLLRYDIFTNIDGTNETDIE